VPTRRVSSFFSRIQGRVHDSFVYQRRIRAIAQAFAPLLSAGVVLDVGCGNGELGEFLMSIRADIQVLGLEVVRRPSVSIPAAVYDERSFPFKDDAFSCVVVADMLHHTQNPEHILREALRVGREGILIKDHFYKSAFERLLLRILDWVGNAPHGVPMRYNYFSRDSWNEMLNRLGVAEEYRVEEVVGQYPGILQRWIGTGIQFVCKLAAR
jgi:SAM-dependent methyltransferase